MASVSLQGVRKTYGDFVALQDTSLDVADGEFVALLGPSGCGKTTTLRIVAGFNEVSAGRVLIGDQDVTKVPPYRRNVGVVFQNYALFPHMTVRGNVEYGLRRRKRPAAEMQATVARVLGLVRLDHLADRYPRQLSGGQQQRVAIARALAIEPDVLLLDEPLSNLDAKLRLEVRQEIRRLQRNLGITTILVTHDQEEAMSVGDRLVVMNQGTIQQVGTPRDIYRRPANAFVADFIGSANFLAGAVSADGLSFQTESGLRLDCRGLAAGPCRVLVRPEGLAVSRQQAPDALPAQVEEVTYLGSVSDVQLRLAGGELLMARLPAGDADDTEMTRGDAVHVRIPPTALVALGAAQA